MHLVYVTAALPLSSGETHITPEILEVQRRGHRVTVVPIRPRRSVIHTDARSLTESTITEPVLSLSIIGTALAEIFRAPVVVLRCAMVLATSRSIPILFKNFAIFPKALWLARLTRRRGGDHIHAHWGGTSATAALVASAVSGIPWSFTVHSWDIPEDNLLEKKAQTANFVRAIDVRGGQELAAFLGPYKHKLCIIHMGVSVSPPSLARKERPPEPLRILLGARLVEVKGHRYALQAVARLKAAGVDVSLDCAGEGPLKATLEKYTKALDILDCVQFLGLIDHQELQTQLRDDRWNVVLLPSIETSNAQEGIPVFLIEAMAAGVPVIATNTGGIPELLEGGTGVLIPQRDPRAIAEALSTLSSDRNLLRHLADAGVRRVRDQFMIKWTVSALLDEIFSGIQSDGAPRR